MEGEKQNYSLDNLDILSEENRKRYLYFVADEVEKKYKEHKKQESESLVTTLFVGDFRPLSNRHKEALNSLELLIPGEFFQTIEYSRVLLVILRAFNLDRASSDYETGTNYSLPDDKSYNLDRFKKDHPGIKLKSEYMFFELKSPKNESSMIIRQRYFDPINKEPLTEVWSASKFKI